MDDEPPAGVPNIIKRMWMGMTDEEKADALVEFGISSEGDESHEPSSLSPQMCVNMLRARIHSIEGYLRPNF